MESNKVGSLEVSDAKSLDINSNSNNTQSEVKDQSSTNAACGDSLLSSDDCVVTVKHSSDRSQYTILWSETGVQTSEVDVRASTPCISNNEKIKSAPNTDSSVNLVEKTTSTHDLYITPPDPLLEILNQSPPLQNENLSLLNELYISQNRYKSVISELTREIALFQELSHNLEDVLKDIENERLE